MTCFIFLVNQSDVKIER